jgi:hypothetical protein
MYLNGFGDWKMTIVFGEGKLLRKRHKNGKRLEHVRHVDKEFNSGKTAQKKICKMTYNHISINLPNQRNLMNKTNQLLYLKKLK